jgi:hypothetical protein
MPGQKTTPGRQGRWRWRPRRHRPLVGDRQVVAHGGDDAAGHHRQVEVDVGHPAQPARVGRPGDHRAAVLGGPVNNSSLLAKLSRQDYVCVVIGGGIRRPEPLLELFEKVVNLVRQHAPDAAIAFNNGPEDCADAALRWLR